MDNRKPINLVWLKRDLRTQDHAPLNAAEQAAIQTNEQIGIPYLIVFFFEPSIIQYPDTSDRHLQFQYHSILEMNKILSVYNRRINIFYAEAIEALEEIAIQYKIQYIFSYQESGTQITYDRDKTVKNYCKAHQIEWVQFQRDGIIRAIRNRKDWDKNWFIQMHTPILENRYSPNPLPAFESTYTIPSTLQQRLTAYPKPFQPAGEVNAHRYLQTFINDRGRFYSTTAVPLRKTIHGGMMSPVGYAGTFHASFHLQQQKGFNQLLIGAAYSHYLKEVLNAYVELYAGAWYRSDDTVIPYFGIEWNYWRLGYTNDINFSHQITAGQLRYSNELSLYYTLNKDRSTARVRCPVF